MRRRALARRTPAGPSISPRSCWASLCAPRLHPRCAPSHSHIATTLLSPSIRLPPHLARRRRARRAVALFDRAARAAGRGYAHAQRRAYAIMQALLFVACDCLTRPQRSVSLPMSFQCCLTLLPFGASLHIGIQIHRKCRSHYRRNATQTVSIHSRKNPQP